MEVIPAIDLRWGLVVRLLQGDFDRETVYSDDPLGVASQWEAEGAPRLHIVDLDGARKGEPVNLGVINGIAALVDIPLQVGGGIRDFRMAEKLLEMGVDRVVIGTAAVQDPKLVEKICKELGSQHVVVAVDAREGKVAIKGWQEETPCSPVEVITRMSQLGVQRFLYTDITRDGTLTQPSFERIELLMREAGVAIQASGGVSSLEHIQKLARLGVEAVVVGSALLSGAFTLEQALKAANQRPGGAREKG